MVEVALITGAKRVGQVVARKIAGYGVNIATTYNTSAQEAKELVDVVQKLGMRAAAFQVDLTEQKQIGLLISDIEKKLGSINYLIYMASIFEDGDSQTTAREQLDRSLGVHLYGALWLKQALASLWQKRGQKGKIVVITDRIVVPDGHPYLGKYSYYVGKVALQASVQYWAREHLRDGITINAVAPGATKRPPDVSEEEWRDLRANILPGITDELMMEQVAETVRFFLGADLVTGQTAVVDAGQNLL